MVSVNLLIQAKSADNLNPAGLQRRGMVARQRAVRPTRNTVGYQSRKSHVVSVVQVQFSFAKEL
jgi:hypothetical protein